MAFQIANKLKEDMRLLKKKGRGGGEGKREREKRRGERGRKGGRKGRKEGGRGEGRQCILKRRKSVLDGGEGRPSELGGISDPGKAGLP